MTIEQIVERIRDTPTEKSPRATGPSYYTAKKLKGGGGTYSKTITALTRYIEGLDNPAAE